MPAAVLSDTIAEISQTNDFPSTANPANGRLESPCKTPQISRLLNNPNLATKIPPTNPPKIVAATPHILTMAAISVLVKPDSLYSFGVTVPIVVSHIL